MRKSIFEYKWGILGFIFIAVVFVGNAAIINKHIFGVIPTYYRVIIPILFVLLLIGNFKEHNFIVQNKKREISVSYVFFIVMIIWIIYGFILLFISPWTNFSEGIKEIVSIVYSIASIYIIIFLCNKEQFENIILFIKIFIAAFIIIGYIEIFSGEHLSSSMLNDPDFIMNVGSGENDIPESMKHIATTIFYNPNDYCAFLSIFGPTFLYKTVHEYKKSIIALNYFFLVGLVNILIIDDAWICFGAFTIGLIIYLAIEKAPIFKWIVSIGILVFSQMLGKYLVAGCSYIISAFFGQKMYYDFSQTVNVASAISSQTENMGNDTGSMFFRLNTYIESIKQMFMESRGAGLGPGSYSEYFAQIAEKKNMMINPHSLWIEILSQYGMVIFILFAGILLYIFVKLCFNYKKTLNKQYILVISMGLVWCFASFAPSSFLKYAYYWIIIGLSLGLCERLND